MGENTATIKLLAGLGNPGPTYAQTRHNAGKWLVAQFCQTQQRALKVDPKFKAEIATFENEATQTRIVLPTTYMNESGLSIAQIMHFYKIPATQILIVHDDLDLPPGAIRLKTGGGLGGHNGLKSISRCLANTQNFHRLRIGIGHPGHKDLVHNYVLNRPKLDESDQIVARIDQAVKLLPEILAGRNWQAFMNHLHQK